ncbi:hypothetical protein [Candidatus Ruminimicrobium bovinum]|uniref:hypothetical protein n=1 Tax=Candidatus Ruminimicrobium bovinum TaxID=3242779 RepID=UPI0039B8C727
MSDKNKIVIENINKEITKIDKKENRVFFFVIDTKGVPSGSLEYIYNLALIAKEDGYDVSMLHTEEEFVGVGAWLGEEYTNLPHYNVNKGEVGTSPSDVLFIPEIYSQVMNQTKNLPCKRVVILQNYDYVVEQMPYAAQWGDFGIMEGITNSNYQAAELTEAFPYVKLTKVNPYLSKIFGNTITPKKMIINVIAKDQSDIKRIVKPFYWKYPYFKWVSFKELRNLSKEDFATALREGAITIVVDDSASVMYSALEAMKSGSITMVKTPNTVLDWADDDELPNCCVWFNDFDTLHKQLASVVRSWITDKIPPVLEEESKKVLSKFSYEDTEREFLSYLHGVLDKRKAEMEELIRQVKKQENE